MRHFIIALSVLFYLTACSQHDSPSSIQTIDPELTDEELASSIIELKELITSSPDELQLRLLLAKAYLYQGKYDFAEKEVNKYLELKAKDTEIESAQTIFEVLFLSESYTLLEQLSTLAASSDNGLVSDLILFSGQRQGFKAKTGLYKDIYPLLSEEKLPELAAVLAENSLTQKNYIPHLVVAKFFYSKAEYSYSSTLFDQLHDLRPYDNQVIVFAATSYLKTHQLNKAEYFADLLSRGNKGNPLSMLIKGTVNFEKSNFKDEERYLEGAISRGLDSFDARLTAALTNYQLGNFEKAYNHFEKIEEKIPPSHPIYQYISATKLILGDPLGAYESSKGLEVNDTTFPLLLNLAHTLRKSGDEEDSDALLKVLDQKDFIDKDISFTLDSYLKTIDQADSIPLETSFNNSSQTEQQRAMLITSLISDSKEQTAIEYLDKWYLESPKDEKLLILKLAALLKLNNVEQAEQTITQMKSIAPAHPLINTFDAYRALKNGDKNKAHEILKSTISDSYYSPWAVKLLINTSRENLNDTVSFLSNVYNENNGSTSLAPTLDLAFSLAMTNQFEKALETIERWEATNADNPIPEKIYELKSVLYLSKNDIRNTKLTLTMWMKSKGISKSYILRALALANQIEDWDYAVTVIDQALSKFNGELSDTLKLIKIRYLLKGNKNPQAIATLSSCSAKLKTTHLWKKLKGQTLAIEKNFSQASLLFSEAYRASNSTETAIYLMQSYYANGQFDSAEKFAIRHLSTYPKDILVRARLAEFLFVKAPIRASEHYDYLYDNGLATTSSLNNHAWLLLNQGESEKALSMAEKAYNKNSGETAVLDTYLKSLIASHKYDEAMKLAESIYNKNSKDFDIAIIYARTLVDIGDDDGAKAVLNFISPQNNDQKNKYNQVKMMTSGN